MQYYFFKMFQKVICIGFIFIFLNFSIQFSNYITANIIEAAVTNATNSINENLNLTYGSSSAGTEEQHEETESSNSENTSQKKTEFLSNSNNLLFATALNSLNNNFIKHNTCEVSIEIPSPPPWA